MMDGGSMSGGQGMMAGGQGFMGRYAGMEPIVEEGFPDVQRQRSAEMGEDALLAEIVALNQAKESEAQGQASSAEPGVEPAAAAVTSSVSPASNETAVGPDASSVRAGQEPAKSGPLKAYEMSDAQIMQQFQAQRFTPGLVPIRPPPPALC